MMYVNYGQNGNTIYIYEVHQQSDPLNQPQ